jgi:hypothetical protein
VLRYQYGIDSDASVRNGTTISGHASFAATEIRTSFGKRSLPCHESRQLGATPRLLRHGWGAEPLRAHWPAAEPCPTLVLEGLAHWAHLERGA